MSPLSELCATVAEVKAQMCDEYCRWPLAYKLDYSDANEAMEAIRQERCPNCPLNKL